MARRSRSIARTAAGLLAAAGVALALALLFDAARPRRAPPVAGPDAEIRLSLLAVGDTGDRHALPSLREGQLSVARGMAAEDRRRPVDALVLLGDNFYPDGLGAGELVERVRVNVVWPYCRFVALAGARSAEVADACRLDPGERRPVPIHAVLGNHDYDLPESPGLQRDALPEFVSNWSLLGGLAEVRELGAGVSLVLFDSPRVRREGAAAALREAIARARGPWRILAGHHPLVQASGSERRPLSEELGVPGARAQLALAGHLHNLQVIAGEPPGPALHVIAGGGSTIHDLAPERPGRLFGLAQTGFARIDLVRDAAGERLVASLYAMPRYPGRFWVGPELVARWSLAPDGSRRRLYPPDAQRDQSPKS